MSEHIAVYPGSFDPITYGHLDLIERALQIFDRLIVAVVTNPGKKPLFTLEERLEMLREVTGKVSGTVEVDSFDELLVNYLRKRNAQVILRGFRAVSDFEYEFEMALANRHMAGEVQTIFMTPSEEFVYVRASLVKEIAMFGGDVSFFVPETVERRLKERCKQNQAE